MGAEMLDMMNLIFSKELLELLGSMFLEGSSLPFPGIIVVLAFGHVLQPTFKYSIFIAFLMSITYTLASFIPYFIGRKLGVGILSIFDRRVKVKAAIEKCKGLVNKYGTITIAMSRPFGWGNQISYIAGISKINPIIYGIFTFCGIYPWSLIMINLGRIYKGDKSIVFNILKNTRYIYMQL
ncbi:hypothetical protein Curi_c06550 [Gottschalkia acidurici 9a]|uniref:VTT domain-containing protein n=2 Tax=Clostridium acidurici TaxID=1556 RepID=K0AV39_GOTA9|nr:hypothetical protein Curi_c06550 [Gottschalkia acidurici 9a]